MAIAETADEESGIVSDAAMISDGEARPRESSRLMYGISAGHGVKHFGQGAILILVPEIKASLDLSDVAIGGMFAARDASMGLANVPAGVLTDMFRHRVPMLLAVSMAFVALGYLLIGISSWYWLSVLALMVLGAGTSLWHAPAFSELAVRYPERRGFAMAAHSTGAQVGNTTAPAMIGLLLGGFSYLGVEWSGLGWRAVSLLLVLPAVLTVLVILSRFKGRATPESSEVSLRSYVTASRRLLRNPSVLSMALMHALRGAAHNSIQLFLVIYMADVLDYSDLKIGVHISLLTLAGIASTPLLGVMSDRLGRRPVMAASLAAISVLVLAFLWADDGWPLTITMIGLGVFLFSIMPVIVAAAMDSTDRGSEGTSVAVLFAGGALIGAAAPVVAGAINTHWDFDGVVVFVAIIAAVGAAFALVAPMGRRTEGAADALKV
ncbi:MAG: MFS transporter [Chloroflexi bacterium]|nr:MFS transporter [Chloroflexota bacterium]